MRKTAFVAGARWGSLQRSPEPLGGFGDGEGEGKGREGKGGEG